MFPSHQRQNRNRTWRVIKTNFHPLSRPLYWKNLPVIGLSGSLRFFFCWLACVSFFLSCGNLVAQSSASPATTLPATTSSYLASDFESTNAPGYFVQSYVIEGRTSLATNDLTSLFAKYTGTNVNLHQIVRAASALEGEYVRQGYPTMNIVIAPRKIQNGVVTLDVFPGAVAQIIVAGNRYLYTLEELAATPGASPSVGTTNQTANAPAATNAGPRFVVQKYLVSGNTVLPPATIANTLTNISGIYGTNVSFDGIRSAVMGLQGAYRDRGYVTVYVSVPQQKIDTNNSVKLRVTEGRLVAVNIKGNHYFSSNNIARAMPSLHTNLILNNNVFQAELNRANANQDRQLYPVIEPGPDPGTSALTLDVKDRLPLHAKMSINNQSSPGTPELRDNFSAVYNNLFQEEQSMGVQYSFSPEEYKEGHQWNFFDRPLVANYSTFYRIPLGSPQAISDAIASDPGSFGYNEATRKFNLPPASGQPELNFFASRSTIDTGLTSTPRKILSNIFTTNSDGSVITNTVLSSDTDQQDITINHDLGFRLTVPLPSLTAAFHSALSGGVDYKTYKVYSVGTNNFFLNTIETANGNPPITIPINSEDSSALPYTVKDMEYLPLSLRYDAGWTDRFGNGSFGVGLAANVWYNSTTTQNGGPTNFLSFQGRSSVGQITGSTNSTGYYFVLTPSISHDFQFVTNWVTTFRADGQWANEPLISNEQFGAGGVNSVRGYHEGEVFGDTGWHVSLEQQTPPYRVGTVYGSRALIVRGSAYMDYAETYLLDPQGGSSHTPLWGTGFGFVATVGPHWESRFLFSLPLLSTTTTQANEPFINFEVTAQF